MPSPTDPPINYPEMIKDPKYAPIVELLKKLQQKEVQESKKPENRTQMTAKDGQTFKFVEP